MAFINVAGRILDPDEIESIAYVGGTQIFRVRKVRGELEEFSFEWTGLKVLLKNGESLLFESPLEEELLSALPNRGVHLLDPKPREIED